MRRYLLLLIFVLCFCFASGAEARKLALLVGVDDYDNVPSLKCCVNDMKALKSALMKVGFMEKDIVLFTTGVSSVRDLPTKEKIERKVADILAAAQSNDMVFFAFSGHGAREGKTDYFCPPFANPDNLEGTCVSITKVMDDLSKCEARFKWMVVDACRNTPNSRDAKSFQVIPAPPAGIALFQSCDKGEKSYEEDREGGNGYFTKNLVSALSGEADTNQDGKLTLLEVCTWTTSQTQDEVAKAENKTQRPYLNLSAADFTLSEDMNVPKAKKLVEEARKAVEDENYELAIQKYDEAIALCPRFRSIKRERNSAQRLLNAKKNYDPKKVTVPDDFPTIEEAYENVKDGGIISILPGKYELPKTLLINRPVTFRGSTGRMEDVVIDCPTMTAFKITGGSPSFQNLTVSSGAGEADDLCGIYISGGKPKFFRCTVKGAGMGVEGEKTNPQVESCIFKNCSGYGVGFLENALGSFTDCEIYENELAGVVIIRSGNPTFNRCKIHDGKEAGALVVDNGLGKFSDCEIYGNKQPGFIVKSSGNPTVTGCKIHDGKDAGVHVLEKGLGKFSDCDIYGNATPGIGVESSANPTVTGCKIHDGKGNGVFVSEKGLGTFSDCDIFRNSTPSFFIEKSANPTVTGCKIRDGELCGVCACNNGLGSFTDCEIYGHAGTGVHVGTSSNPTFTKCKIYDGQKGGVEVYDNGLGKFSDCEIYRNASVGITVKESSNPTFTGCKIYNGKACGVWVHDKGRGTFNNNTLENNYQDGELLNWYINSDAGFVNGYGNTPPIP